MTHALLVIMTMSHAEKSTYASFLEQHPLFDGHGDVVRALLPSVSSRTYAKDAAVLHHADAANSLLLVLKGWVKLTRQTPDGKETIVGLCTEGDVLGEAALFAHASYPYHAQALVGDTELLFIPAGTIRQLVAQHGWLSASLMELLHGRNGQAQLKLEQMNTMSAAQRLGCFLLRLCNTQPSGMKRLQVPVEKHIVAAYLGMKPETLSRSQQQLKPLGITTQGHEVVVEQIEKLREFVCSSCSESGSCDTEASS